MNSAVSPNTCLRTRLTGMARKDKDSAADKYEDGGGGSHTRGSLPVCVPVFVWV